MVGSFVCLLDSVMVAHFQMNLVMCISGTNNEQWSSGKCSVRDPKGRHSDG